MKHLLPLFVFILLSFSLSLTSLAQKRQMEYLDRGLVAVKTSSGVYLSWRYLGTDDPATGFNIYRDDVLISPSPITTSTNYTDASGTSASVYKVVPVLNGQEDVNDLKTVTPWAQSYKTIQLKRPANGITEPNQYGSVGKTASGVFPNGQPYGYSPNDCSVGDLDGDGEYEIIVKWDPSNSQDNSYYGITGEVFVDAYKLDGTQIWRISLGKNIRAGAHYTQFLVYDFDGDGLGELICKTAPGTRDGQGKNVIMGSDSPTADYRNLDVSQISGSSMLGTIKASPEYLTLFDGRTGGELNTIAYNPLRGASTSWGKDDYYNRSDRFLACVAYLNGVKPSAVMCRGYYQRTTLAAFYVEDKKLVQQWLYDSGNTAGVGAYGQGNHNLSVADVDADGYDEIVYGACAIDNDGELMYRTGLGHGDAMHLSDLDPDRAGLEVWEVHEDAAAWPQGFEMHDAKTGEIIWSGAVAADNGRGLAADIDSRYPGFEMWSTSGSGTYSCKGVQISTSRPSVNFRIYWDGDLQDELLDGVNITKWTGSGTTNLLSASGVKSCNSTKATPNLSADILGDWREELILWTSTDSSKLQVYTTTTPTAYRLFTPMHDAVYRLGIAWQNAAYNQPPHLGFYIGGGVDNIQQPNIATVRYTPGTTAVGNATVGQATLYCSQGVLWVKAPETIQEVEVYSLAGTLLYVDKQVNRTEFSYPLPPTGKLFVVRVRTAAGVQVGKVVR